MFRLLLLASTALCITSTSLGVTSNSSTNVPICGQVLTDNFVEKLTSQKVVCLHDQGDRARGNIVGDWKLFCATPSCVRLSSMAISVLKECRPATNDILPMYYCSATCQATLDHMRALRLACDHVTKETPGQCRACTQYAVGADTLVRDCGLWEDPVALQTEPSLWEKLVLCKEVEEANMDDADEAIKYSIGGAAAGVVCILIAAVAHRVMKSSGQRYSRLGGVDSIWGNECATAEEEEKDSSPAAKSS
ncbi:Aste57867_20891 [Aphanomyces stellatus]|uniref:Aste57867_20891 protein n=1 Tax=Aphanomyces stellatus TaxID=120398 RepID=A0A485LG76_9STRA|nr:hypothetical protein As57867_020823 [Aphanomyces stellatus]VFT97568.1 Aste57867_20891 [Aphanomyces stellatus]